MHGDLGSIIRLISAADPRRRRPSSQKTMGRSGAVDRDSAASPINARKQLSKPKVPPAAPNTACANCSRRKKSCTWPADAAPGSKCERCARLDDSCEAQETNTSRRERERRRRAQRWREARSAAREAKERGPAKDEPSGIETPGAAGSSHGSGNISTTMVTTAHGAGQNNRAVASVAIAEQVKAFVTTSLSPGSSPSSSSFSSGRLSGGRASPRLSPTSVDQTSGSGFVELDQEQYISSIPRGMGRGYEEHLMVCLNAFWEHWHITSPMVHRLTLEDAFVSGRSAVYGSHPPLALLYSMAANGARFANSQIPSEGDRMRAARYFCECAKNLLLAGYYSTNQPIMTDLEAAQTLYLIYHFLIPEKAAQGAKVLLERAVDILVRLCTDRVTGNFIGHRIPLDHNEWVTVEMTLRLYILLSLWDAAQAYIMGRDLLVTIFGHRFPLPSHDSYFSLPSQQAFLLLYATHTAPSWTTVDMSYLLQPYGAPNPDAVIACSIVDEIIWAVFHHKASHLAAAYCLCGLREYRRHMRMFAESHGVDSIALASKPAVLDTPAEALYRKNVATFEAMVHQFVISMPEDVGQPLMTAADPRPLLLLANNYFPDVRYAHAFVCTYMSARCMQVENWLPGMDINPPREFFSSNAFVAVLESGINVVRIMEHQMAFEPGLRWNRPWAFVPVLRVAGLHVAAIKMCRDAGIGASLDAVAGFEGDVRVIWRWLKTMGDIHLPLGESNKQVSASTPLKES